MVSLALVWACGDGSPATTERPVDSQMVAEHVDPSTKFPQQIVETDSVETDKRFVPNALERSGETIALANLAAGRAVHPEVKAVAQLIAGDQRAISRSLGALAKQREPKDSSTRFSDGSLEELKKLAGDAFDRQWVEKMVTWNAADISRYAAEAEAAKNKAVRRVAGEALSRLKVHQQQLESCRSKLQ